MKELADRPIRIPSEPIIVHYARLFTWILELRLAPKWHERYKDPLSWMYRTIFYDRLTCSGKILFITSAITFLLSLRVPGSFFSNTSATGFAILLTGSVLGTIFRPYISIKRECPDIGFVNQKITSLVTITNTGFLPVLNFTVREMAVPDIEISKEWRLSHHNSLPKRSSKVVPASFIPKKRGVLKLDGLCIQSYFPFFMTRSYKKIASSVSLYILPEATSLLKVSIRKLTEEASSAISDDPVKCRKKGVAEYAYSRQYQQGDSIRRLDHRASGRTGIPMSKVFEGVGRPSIDSIYIIFDNSLYTFLPWQPRPQNYYAFDLRLSLLCEIATSAQNDGLALKGLSIGSKWSQIDSPLAFYKIVATCSASRSVALPDTMPAYDGLYIIITGRWSDVLDAYIGRLKGSSYPFAVFMIPETEKDIGTLPAKKGYVEITA